MKVEEQVRTYFSNEHWLERWVPLFSLATAITGLIPLFGTLDFFSGAMFILFPSFATIAWHGMAARRLSGMNASESFPRDIRYAFPSAWVVGVLCLAVPNILSAVFFALGGNNGYLPTILTIPIVGAWCGFWFACVNTLASLSLYLLQKGRRVPSLNFRTLRFNNIAALGLFISLASLFVYFGFRTYERPLSYGHAPKLQEFALAGFAMLLGAIGFFHTQLRLSKKSRWLRDATRGEIKGVRVDERIDEATQRIERVALEVEREDGGAYRTGETSKELLRWEEAAPHK